MRRLRTAMVVIIGSLSIVSSAAADPLLINGGFETGLAGWTVVDQIGGSGSWFSQSGTGSPLNGFGVPSPPEGSFTAMTDQGGPGSHLLYQDFVVPTGVTSAQLSYQRFMNNQAGTFYNPGHLNVFADVPNQHARVDIISTTGDPFSTAAGDVLLNLEIILANIDPYASFSTDLTAFLQAHEGETLRLRFAQADNQLFFSAGVDDVDLDVTAVPEPSALALLGVAVAFARRSIRRRG